MAHFEIKDLTFSYASAKGRHSLENVSLTIEQGEFLVLCGKSGSGKSTLLRQLKTVLTPNGNRTGEILFRGVPLKQVSDREQSEKIGFVMQNPDDQIVTDKVWHELAFGLARHRSDTPSHATRSVQYNAHVLRLLDRLPVLSLVRQQRVQLLGSQRHRRLRFLSHVLQRRHAATHVRFLATHADRVATGGQTHRETLLQVAQLQSREGRETTFCWFLPQMRPRLVEGIATLVIVILLAGS